VDSIYGAHDAGWLSFYAFFREVCGLESRTEKLAGLFALAQHAGWALPHARICWVSERHSVLRRDDRGRLHSLTGPAVAYPDGWEIYAVHGVRVPAHVVLNPERIAFRDIVAEPNAEVRRVLRERYGEGRYLVESGARVVDRDSETARKGAAPRVLLEDREKRRFLVGTDGSTKRTYYMEVPSTVETCREAHAALCGFDEGKILNKS